LPRLQHQWRPCQNRVEHLGDSWPGLVAIQEGAPPNLFKNYFFLKKLKNRLRKRPQDHLQHVQQTIAAAKKMPRTQTAGRCTRQKTKIDFCDLWRTLGNRCRDERRYAF
jgi:hypothetical protein